MTKKSWGTISNSRKFIYFKALSHRSFHFFLSFLIVFQSATVFPQSHQSIFNLQSIETEPKAEPQSSNLIPIEHYDAHAPLTINPGSFSAAPGQYLNHPTPKEDYITNTKLGYSISKLQDVEFMIQNIYQLHNALIAKIRGIEIEQGENANEYLTRIAGTKRTPQVVQNIGTAELAKVDGKFLVRVIHNPTDTVFYILDETNFSEEDDYYLKQLQARQHLMGGHSRLDGQRGRDVIFLWKNGTRNTKAVISPRIETNIKSPTEHTLPMLQDPAAFQETRRQHRRLHRQEYWAAIASKITTNNLTFALGMAVIQAAITATIGFSKEFISGEGLDIGSIALLSFFFTLSIYTFPSSYRYWINMGKVGFLQKKPNTGKNTNFLEQFRGIDWKETFRSKVSRNALTSLAYSYIFLFMTNDQIANLDILDINNIPIFIQLFLLAQLIALPNFIINNSSKVWWTEQAQVNEIAGVTNRDISIPFFSSIKWNYANIDYALFKYNASQIVKLTHLLDFALPAVFISSASAIGINLNTLGINAGLVAMLASIWLGQYFLLKQVLNFHQKKYLDNEQTWHYMDRITQSILGKSLIRAEVLRRRFLLWWHRFHIQNSKSNNSFYQVFDMLSPTEMISDIAKAEREERHLERWEQHNDVLSHIESEMDFYENSQQITKSLEDMQSHYLQYAAQQAPTEQLNPDQQGPERLVLERLDNTSNRQVIISFNNFARVLHALFETLKARNSFNREGLSQEESFDSAIWERNKSIEQDDIMDFIEEHLTEEFPLLQQALDFLKKEELTLPNTAEEPVELEKVLTEFQVFMERHFEPLLGYMNEQEIKNFYQSKSVMTEKTDSHFHYSFDKKRQQPAQPVALPSSPTQSPHSSIDSPSYALCAGALDKK